MIAYKIENNLGLQEFKQILLSSTFADRRPFNDDDGLTKMLSNASLIITARDKGILVGVSRSISDFSYCTYLSDLAVSSSHQHQGIGKELIRRTKIESKEAKVILLSAPLAVSYYPKIGIRQFDQCFILDELDDLKN